MSATLDFVELMSSPGEVALDEALFMLGECRPESSFTVTNGLVALDELASGCEGDSVDALVRHLFVTHGFGGDAGDYHHPDNAYLDEVLRRKRGMPISLSILLIEVGRRLGIELDGVGMPGHFLVRERGAQSFIDPFYGGVRIGASDCQARFHAIQGDQVPFKDSYLDPVHNRAIVVRVLNNLTHAYLAREPKNLDWLLDIRIDIFPEPNELRTLAQLCERRARYGDAANLLEQLLEFLDEGRTHKAVADRVVELRARLN